MSWMTPTKYLQRFGDAMQLLCGGHRPTDAMMAAWLDPEQDSFELQEFAFEHGPEWAQGIGLIDAARVLADQPTEILTIDGPQLDHERIDPAAPLNAAALAAACWAAQVAMGRQGANADVKHPLRPAWEQCRAALKTYHPAGGAPSAGEPDGQ